jgi:hypothetical protein
MRPRRLSCSRFPALPLALLCAVLASGVSFGDAGQKQPKRSFQFVGRTCESGCDETYRSSDGQELTVILACYSSTAKDARRDLREAMGDGRVVKRGWRRDWHGRRGERVVALYPRDETGDKPAKIFWYVPGDVCFSYIQTGSLALALEFERSKLGREAMYGIT